MLKLAHHALPVCLTGRVSMSPDEESAAVPPDKASIAESSFTCPNLQRDVSAQSRPIDCDEGKIGSQRQHGSSALTKTTSNIANPSTSNIANKASSIEENKSRNEPETEKSCAVTGTVSRQRNNKTDKAVGKSDRVATDDNNNRNRSTRQRRHQRRRQRRYQRQRQQQKHRYSQRTQQRQQRTDHLLERRRRRQRIQRQLTRQPPHPSSSINSSLNNLYDRYSGGGRGQFYHTVGCGRLGGSPGGPDRLNTPVSASRVRWISNSNNSDKSSSGNQQAALTTTTATTMP